jgi:trimeric autotransporter adhesin
MPTPHPNAPHASLRRFAQVALGLGLALLSCGREITGPAGELRLAQNIAFVAQFPGPLASVAEGAGSVVAFDRIRVLLRRTDGSVGLDRVVQFGAGQDSVVLDLRVPLRGTGSDGGEPLALNLAYLNAVGDTVFRGGPVDVIARPQGTGSGEPSPVPVPLTYTGPGASAVAVAIAPESLVVVAGAPFTFTAAARDAQQSVVAAAPFVFRSLDTSRARISAPGAGAGTAREPRGEVRIAVDLAAGGAADTAVLIVLPRPGQLTLRGGGAQTAVAGSALPDSVRVRLLATDGLALSDVPLAIAVATGGGLVSADTLVTDANGDIAFAWTLGSVAGAQTLTVRGAGVSDLTVSASASEAPLVATQLVITQQVAQAQVVGANVVPALRVEARDAAGVRVPTFTDSVVIAIGENPGGATLGGTLRVAAVGGIATFSAWNLSAVGSGYTVVASAPGLATATSAPFDVGSGGAAILTVVSGDAQTGYVSQALTQPIVVRVTDALAAPVAGVTVTFSVTGGGGSTTGATASTNANGDVTLGSWTLGAAPGPNTLSVIAQGTASATITATGILPPPEIALAVVGSNVVGFDRAGTLRVQLLQPAPVGGLTVSLVSTSPALLSIAPPGSLDFTAGQTVRTIEMSGLAIGTATVIGTAPGYTPDTLLVPVSLNLISLPPTLNVPLAQTRSLPVQLSAPAPAGGVAVAIVSSDPSIARPLVDTVIVAAGAQSVNATIEGLALGSATFTASNPNYAQDQAVASVTAALNIVATSVAPNGSFAAPITVRLESGGTPVSAPAGGIALTFVSRDAACASIAPAGMIGAGLVSTTLDVSYGGTATLPCTTRIVVSGPEGFTTDSVTTNVGAIPGFNLSASSLGSGLQRNIGASVTTSNHPGVLVRVTSLDSSIVLVSPSVATAGSGSYETTLLPGATSIPLVISSVAGRIADTIAVRVEATGFATGTFSVYVWQPVFQLTGLNATGSTLAADDPFYVTVGTPLTPAGTSIWYADDVRRGGGPLSASIINDTPALATLVTLAGTVDSLAVTIAEGTNISPTTVAAGGVAFRPLAAGTASVRSGVANLRPLAAATGTVTISQPAITLATDYLGSGLQRARSINTAGSPAPAGGTAVTITAARPGVVQFAPDVTTAGSDTIVVTIPEGGTSASFIVQAADDIVADTVLITASAPGYTAATAEQRVWSAVYQITGLNASGTPLTADDPFYVSIGTPLSPTGTSIWVADERRAGAAPFGVSIVNGTPATATFVNTAGTTDSVLVFPAAGATTTPTNVAAGGVALRYLAAGTATVRATIPGAGVRALAAATATVTVNSTALSIATDYIGSGLQRTRSVSVSAPAPAGGIPVTLTADRLGVVQFAPNATTLGSDTLVVTIAAGATSAAFFVQGVEGILADTVTITASSPGYASATGEQRVWQAVVEMPGIPSTLNTLAPDDPFTVQVGTPLSPTGTSIWASDNVRFGAPALTATIVSGTSTVGQLVSTARTGDTVTVQINAGTRISPSTVALGGAAFQSLTTGTTVVQASIPGYRSVGTAAGQTVTITAPAISMSTINDIGAGLQLAASGTLNAGQHGGVNVVIRSSNPALVRVAPSAGVAATDSIVIPLANGVVSFSYVVAAEDGVTGQTSVTASAVGFTDASSTVAVVAPMLELSGVLLTRAAGGVDDPFRVSIGVPVTNLTSLSQLQARRAGAAPLIVSVVSSVAGVATLTTTERTADSVTVAIVAGQSQSAISVVTGGLAVRYLTPGTSTLRASHPVIARTTTSGTATVTVTTPVIALAAIPTVGAGLQVAATGSLTATNHGGINVVVRSSDPSRVRVAHLATEVAADSIVIPIADGVTTFDYVVVGIEETTGTATVDASSSDFTGFTGAQRVATVVAPRLDLSGLVTSRAAGGADDPFLVRVGIPNATNATLTATQNVRAGAAPLVVTITSGTPTVGTLVTTALTAGSVTVQIAPGTFASPATVVLDGAAFRYLTAGTSVVTLSHATLLPTTTSGTATVTVTP